MCGILSVINIRGKSDSAQLIDATSVIRHRGPDDEGFLTWKPGSNAKVWAGKDTAHSTKDHWKYEDLHPGESFKVGLGHRRLSILDLSPTGHQPMLFAEAQLSIVFNGEIYNYLEIKEELRQAGHQFTGTSDTEVILHAWAQWGSACLHKFNGMFAFVLLDERKQELYAVRDRFGVKPLYYYTGTNAIYLASEIKQISTAPGFQFSLNETSARQFLATGATEHTDNTFDTQIKQLPGGHYLHIDLADSDCKMKTVRWYQLPNTKWRGSFEDAATQLKTLLTDSVRVRLRSDVKVGSCLSGGLDSSSIVCLAADLLQAQGDHAGQETVTACFDNARYDEWSYAQQVIAKTKAHPHRVFPSFTQLQEDLDTLLWYQDEPFGSTSIFSQWAVFKETNRAGLKVMIDGQGADEQLAGYGGNDLSYYTGMLQQMKWRSLNVEARHYKSEKGHWPKGFLLGAAQLTGGKGITQLLPKRLRLSTHSPADWVLHQNNEGELQHAHSLRENLVQQLYSTPLPGLLRYEDHNSMAWSVESRTPFLDYRLVEFNMSLPERYVYNKGVRKHVLRKAMHGVIPEAIEQRRDKMGFVTPEEVWLKEEGRAWFSNELEAAYKKLDRTMIDATAARKYVAEIMDGKRTFNFMPWRIICFNRWLDKQ